MFGCDTKPASQAPPSSASVEAAPVASAAPGPVAIAGIAIQATADFGVGDNHVWAIAFNEVEDSDEAAAWAKGIRGFDMSATAAPAESAAVWNKVGPGIG
jgi:hypothetical protein